MAQPYRIDQHYQFPTTKDDFRSHLDFYLSDTATESKYEIEHSKNSGLYKCISWNFTDPS